MAWEEKHPTLVKVARSRYTRVALVICVGILWLHLTPPESPWSPRRIAGAIMPEPRETVRIERIEVPGPERIRVITKERIIEKFKDLPTPATMQDNGAQVVAIAVIPESPTGGMAIAVLHTDKDNVATGSIEYQPKAAPFLQVKRKFYGEGWYYPVGDRQAEAAVGVNPLRIGPVEIKAKAGIDLMRENSQIRGFIAIGGEIHF